MAHNILELDRGISKGAPWHIGQTADRWRTVDETLTPEAAGLIAFARQDGESGIWNPRKVATFARAGGQDFVCIPDSFHVVRDDMGLDDPKRFISAGRGVSSKFTLVTNQDIIDYCNALSNRGAFVESAGSLFNGTRVWMSLCLENGDMIRDEPVGGHLLLTSAHDGTACFEAMIGVVLTVCWNTLSFNRSNSPSRYKIKHTVNVSLRLQEADAIITAAVANFADSTTIMRNLADKALSDQAAKTFTEKVFGDSKRAEKQIERVLELYHGAQLGAQMESRKGTLFGLVNATSQYLETESGISVHKDQNGVERDENEVRTASVLFGAAGRKRDEMLNLAMSMVDA